MIALVLVGDKLLAGEHACALCAAGAAALALKALGHGGLAVAGGDAVLSPDDAAVAALVVEPLNHVAVALAHGVGVVSMLEFQWLRLDMFSLFSRLMPIEVSRSGYRRVIDPTDTALRCVGRFDCAFKRTLDGEEKKITRCAFMIVPNGATYDVEARTISAHSSASRRRLQ